MDNNEGRDEKGRFTEKNMWSYVRENFNGGRPRHYDDPITLITKGLEYFEWCDQVRKGKYTEAGLRLFLGFTNRQSWSDYKHNPMFSDIIYTLESIMEDDVEQKLMWAGSTQGAIFKLKNKHGWKDEVTQHQTVTNVTASFGNPIHTTPQPEPNPSGDKQ